MSFRIYKSICVEPLVLFLLCLVSVIVCCLFVVFFFFLFLFGGGGMGGGGALHTLDFQTCLMIVHVGLIVLNMPLMFLSYKVFIRLFLYFSMT